MGRKRCEPYKAVLGQQVPVAVKVSIPSGEGRRGCRFKGNKEDPPWCVLDEVNWSAIKSEKTLKKNEKGFEGGKESIQGCQGRWHLALMLRSPRGEKLE